MQQNTAIIYYYVSVYADVLMALYNIIYEFEPPSIIPFWDTYVVHFIVIIIAII